MCICIKGCETDCLCVCHRDKFNNIVTKESYRYVMQLGKQYFGVMEYDLDDYIMSEPFETYAQADNWILTEKGKDNDR